MDKLAKQQEKMRNAAFVRKIAEVKQATKDQYQKDAETLSRWGV